jgi:hypothetical protein
MHGRRIASRGTLKILVPATLVLLLLALGSSPIAFASHTHTTHFKATLTGTFAFTSESTIAASGKGTASHLGHITAEGTVSVTSNTGSPSLIITAANGDKLFLTAVGTATFTSSTTAVFSGTYTIIGGTGHLVHAAGHGTIRIVADLTSSSGGTFVARINGSISR